MLIGPNRFTPEISNPYNISALEKMLSEDSKGALYMARMEALPHGQMFVNPAYFLLGLMHYKPIKQIMVINHSLTVDKMRQALYNRKMLSYLSLAQGNNPVLISINGISLSFDTLVCIHEASIQGNPLTKEASSITPPLLLQGVLMHPDKASLDMLGHFEVDPSVILEDARLIGAQ